MCNAVSESHQAHGQNQIPSQQSEGGGERQIEDDGERVNEGTKTIKGNLGRELEGTRHERIKERALRGGQAISWPSSFCCWSLFSDCHVTLWAQYRGGVWHAASQKIYSRGQRSTGTRDPGIEVLVAPQGEEKWGGAIPI